MKRMSSIDLNTVDQFNNTYREYPRNRTLGELFQEQAARTPDHTAVEMYEEKLSYAELNSWSNQFANYISSKTNNGANNNIAVVMNSSIHYIVSILSILKAGCAYVPINPQYPIERIRYILDKCNVKTVITESQYFDLLSDVGLDIENVDVRSFSFSDRMADNLPTRNNAEDLAYVMFTSGTTGQPKGVMIKHNNIVKLVVNTTYVTFTSKDKVLQAGAIVFDASTFEIWGALLNGATLCLVEKDTLINVKKFQAAVTRHKISIMCLTTPLFVQLVQMDPTIFQTLRTLIVGGDVLPAKTVDKLLGSCKDVQLLNGYGPTECTTFATAWKVNPGEPVTIGGPIDNTTVYILDEQMKRLPVGETGEIYIGGDGVGKGYINEPELTSERFIENPNNEGEIIYRTGDLGRWEHNGNIEYLGRIDNQIKVRGHRVELNEIESIIGQVNGVIDTHVFYKKDENGQGDIYAFYTSDTELTENDVRDNMSKILPDYMHPKQIVRIDSVPLNINGKIDKDKLYSIAQERTSNQKELLFSSVAERELYQIWKSVLNVDGFGLDDDFFDLGGHSLLAIKLITELQSKFELEISLSVIYKYPTVSKMHAYVQEQNKQKRTIAIFKRASGPVKKMLYPASDAQKRMYVVNHYNEIGSAYNVIASYKLTGSVDTDKLKGALSAIVKRHEILRTSFEYSGGNLYQRIHEHAQVELTIISDVSEDELDHRIHAFIKNFDLSQYPLIQFGLFQLHSGASVLVINAHHIIVDRASVDILLKDFFDLYNNKELPEITCQFADYSERFLELQSNHYFSDSEKFWKEQLKGELPALEIPSDYVRPHTQSFVGERFAIPIPNLVGRIDRFINKMSVTPFTFYTAVFNILLAKYSGEEDIIVGSPVTARMDKELNHTIGMFTNTIVIRSYPQSPLIFSDFVNQVKATIVAAFDHQHYPFEKIINDTKIERDMSRNPLYNVMILLAEEIEYQKYNKENIDIEPYPVIRKTAKCDLTLKVQQNQLEFEYCTKIFSAHNICTMAKHLLNIIDQVLSNPDIKIAEIDMLGEEEREQIVESFNASNKLPVDFENATLKELFESKADLKPNAIALKVKGIEFTYKQLNDEANQLAHYLIDNGVGQDTQVGLLMDASYEMILGILAVFKAGGAFVPIDPETPSSRIHHILNNSDIRMLLTTGAFRSIPEELNIQAPTCVLDESHELFESYSLENPERRNDPHHLAYMIYTSGSTGVPKGVMVEQRNLINYLLWFKEQSSLTKEEDTVLLSSFSFDLGYTVLFSTLFFGGTLHLLPKSEYLNPQKLLTYFSENHIKLIKITPSFFSLICQENLLQQLEGSLSLRLIVLGGERTNANDVMLFHSFFPEVQFMNHYGPTETTIGSIANVIENPIDVESYTIIGKPISNTSVHILNKDKQPQPIGVPGEIYISGLGVSRGYHQNAALTQERFVRLDHLGSDKAYRTGDYGKFLQDGRIVYMGRKDRQIKFKGYRIELPEIERHVLSIPGVKQAAIVMTTDTDNNQHLLCYAAGSHEHTRFMMQQMLRDKLPEYMIPTDFIHLSELPINGNGKLDVSRLPTSNVRENSGNPDKPSQLETYKSIEPAEFILQIWSKNLGHDDFDDQDNFFEVGGSSLMLVKMYEELNEQYPGVLTMMDLFNYPNIYKLATYVCERLEI